jgi:hypothetical protein
MAIWGYKPHIKQRREEAHEKLTTPGFMARRWVVERTHSWINRFRKLLVSFEKTEAGYSPCLALGSVVGRMIRVENAMEQSTTQQSFRREGGIFIYHSGLDAIPYDSGNAADECEAVSADTRSANTTRRFTSSCL